MSGASPDLVVIGGGVTGVATARAAARRGLRTLLLEQFDIGNHHGSSHGPSRIIRLAYRASDYVTLAREAFILWSDLERRCDNRLLRRTGGLDFGGADVPSLQRTVETMRSCDVPFQLLPYPKLADQFPQLSLEPHTYGVYQPDAAVLDADASVQALAASALAHGAEIQERAKARHLRTVSGGVVIDVNGVPLHAGAAVVAAGSWTNQLLTELCPHLPLTVTREQVAYFAAHDNAAYSPDRFPLAIEHRRGRPPMISIFPLLDTGGGVKLMLDRNGPQIDPEDLNTDLDRPALEALTQYARDRLPGLGPVLKAQTCRYTMTPDEDFIVDLIPDNALVGVASACSGHGFKFAPVLGDVMVDLITTGSTSRPVTRFRINRAALQGRADRPS